MKMYTDNKDAFIRASLNNRTPEEVFFVALCSQIPSSDEIINEFIKRSEINVNTKFFENPPIFYAAATNFSLNKIHALVEGGIDVNAIVDEGTGNGLLHLLLLNLKKTMESENNKNWPDIFDEVEFLIKEKRADLNVTNSAGDTPLHIAMGIMNIHAIKIITLLVDNGAVIKENKQGKKPEDLISTNLSIFKDYLELKSAILSSHKAKEYEVALAQAEQEYTSIKDSKLINITTRIKNNQQENRELFLTYLLHLDNKEESRKQLSEPQQHTQTTVFYDNSNNDETTHLLNTPSSRNKKSCCCLIL